MCAGDGENRSAIVFVPPAPNTDALGFGHAAPEDEAVPDYMCIGCECVFSAFTLTTHQKSCPAYAELESESEDEEEEEEESEEDGEEEEEDEDSEIARGWRFLAELAEQQGRGLKRARRGSSTPGVED